MNALGRHVLVEFHDSDPEVLNSLEVIRDHMLEAARVSGATIVGEAFHRFSPHGVSGAVVIAESHLSIHTWPEYGYAAVDLFTCGLAVDPWKAFAYLEGALRSRRVSHTEIRRGLFPADGDESLAFKPAPSGFQEANC
ncbi:MAG: adenosylmethionine decarboxylase [Deltaproteobacteria bacterium]|nr:adenosylmethionine decarboxylase [Deltaproteobacteria bacterium]